MDYRRDRVRPTIADELISMTRREVLLLSAAMSVPRLALAQQMGSSPVGVLDPTDGPRQSTLAALREGLEDAAYRSFMPIEYRSAGWTDNRFDPLLTLAIDLVICDVGVIVTGNLNGIRAAKAATTSIPIVFFAGSDVIEAGLIESPDRPGGNLTGIVIPSEGHLEQLDLLTKLLPQAREIALLVNPNSKAAETQIQEMQEAARSIGVELKILQASAEGDFEADFADLAKLHHGHDLATVAHISHRIAVMYLGQIVELADSLELCAKPLHPYTQALFTAALPSHPDERHERLTITGEVPSALDPPSGCRFHPRCPHAMPQCAIEVPLSQEVAPHHTVACHLY